MNKINLKLRAKFNEKFCNAIDRGKCCYKPQAETGFCTYHFQLLSLLVPSLSKPKKNTTYSIDYEINFTATFHKCRIFEKQPKTKKLIPCNNPIHSKGLCKSHFKILELTDLLSEFLNKGLPSI